MLQEIEQRSARLYGLTGEKKLLPLGAVIWGLFCVLFLGVGGLGWLTSGRPDPFLIGFGILSAVVALLAFQRNRKLGLNC